jgi:hypothetical protein
MRLTTIKPSILEAEDEDDTFAAVTPYSSPDEQVAKLKHREAAIKHELQRLYREGNDLGMSVKGTVDVNSIPGAKLDKEIAANRLVRISNDYAVPNTPENQPLIQSALRKYKRYVFLNARRMNIHNDILIAKQSASAHVLAQQGKVAGPQIPESNVPAQISSGKGKFRNPYFLSDVGRYAGDPVHFPWTVQMQRMYKTLEDILTKHGLLGFSVIYGSTLVLQSSYTPIALSNNQNFAATNANGKLVWRKYDMGGGSGQNWIYVDGQKMKTSTFIRLSQAAPIKFGALIAKLV